MKLIVYRRIDRILVVVPATMPTPTGLSKEGALERLGIAFIALGDLSLALDFSLATRGYGLANESDNVLIQASILSDVLPGRTEPFGAIGTGTKPW